LQKTKLRQKVSQPDRDWGDWECSSVVECSPSISRALVWCPPLDGVGCWTRP
jgi:hypothetical protein